jgi:hypothetical protein
MHKAKAISEKKIGFKKKVGVVSALNFFLNPNFFFAIVLMYVSESPPAKIGGSRPTGLGAVVVSAVTVQLNEKRVAVVLTKR